MGKELTQEQWETLKPISEVLPLTPITQKHRFSEYDNIELTDEEKEDALAYRRMLKGRHMEEEQKLKERQDKIKKWKEPFTCEQLREKVLERTKQLPFEFVIDKDNERIFDLLCLYFSGDARFNEQKFKYADGREIQLSLKKGIGLISSKKGTGKSILSSLFQQNKFRPYQRIETKHVAAMFQKDGERAIDIHSDPIRIAPHPNYYFFEYIGICFDDLGWELPKTYWGSKSDVMADVLFSIYRKNQMHGDYSGFHFTSNLSGKDFEERYDDRVRDRMREMFNVLIVPGESRRK